jgi:predicted phage terminase large subunit-like protein
MSDTTDDSNISDMLKKITPEMIEKLPCKEKLELLSLIKTKLKYRCEQSFYTFFQNAWPYMWPNIIYCDAWYYKLLCNECQTRVEKNLANLPRESHLNVNILPGSGKTSIISIALPAWIWIKDPTKRFITTSYSPKLAEDNNDKSTSLMQSEWYQGNWGDRFALTKTLAMESKNDRGGYRITTSPGSKVGTGYHFDFNINDDPQNAEEVYSKVYRANVQRWIDQTISSRAVDKLKSVMINVQQRLHGDDITAYIRKNQESLWSFFVLPGEVSDKVEPAELKAKYVNGFLDNVRFPAEVLSVMKIQFRNAYSGQVRQDPIAEGGNLFKDEFPRWYTPDQVPQMERIIVSADTSNTSDADSCPTSIQIWGKAAGAPAYYLLYDETTQMTPGRGLTRIDALSNMYPRCQIVVENAASGFGIIEALKKRHAGVFAFNPQKFGGKEKRAESILYLWEAGNVFLPDTEYARSQYLTEIIAFPTGEFNDRVDSMSQALIWMTRGQHADGGRVCDPPSGVY